MGVPLGLSVKRRTFGTLGFSAKNVWWFPEVISIELECKYLAAVFCIFSKLISSFLIVTIGIGTGAMILKAGYYVIPSFLQRAYC